MFDRCCGLYLLVAARVLIELANTTVYIFTVDVLLPCEVQRCLGEQEGVRALTVVPAHSVAQGGLRD